jgi:hypothetical protein
MARQAAALRHFYPLRQRQVRPRKIGRPTAAVQREGAKESPGWVPGLQGHERNLEGGKSLGSPTIIQKRESRNQKDAAGMSGG